MSASDRQRGWPVDEADPLEGPTLEGPGIEAEHPRLEVGDDEDTLTEKAIPRNVVERLSPPEAEAAAPQRDESGERALADAVEEAVDDLRAPRTDLTQQVREADIQAVFDIPEDAAEEPREGLGPAPPVTGGAAQPKPSPLPPPIPTPRPRPAAEARPPGPGQPGGSAAGPTLGGPAPRLVRLRTLVVVTILCSLASAALAAGLVLAALASASVRERLLGGDARPEAATPDGTPRGAGPEAASQSVPDGGHPVEPRPTAREVSRHAEDSGPHLAEPDAGVARGPSPQDTEVPPQEREGPAEREATPQEDAGSADPAVTAGPLPLSFEAGRPTIAEVDRAALRRVAEGVLADRRTRYELVGFTAPGEAEDAEVARALAARRASRALDLLRSLGPSSQRFAARAARADEAAPAGGPGTGCVVIRPMP